MDRSAIKTFAVWARQELRAQVTARLKQFGITTQAIVEPQTVAGGLIVAGQTLDAEDAKAYELLRSHLNDLLGGKAADKGLKAAVESLIDEIAYTWFNRFSALRYMEVNGYLRRRVLSSSDVQLVDPDILREASSIAAMGDVPGLTLAVWEDWQKLASKAANADEFLYRRLLNAQCAALAEGLPFLFEVSKQYTALFMPANLLNAASVVRRLVADIPEEDWRDSSGGEADSGTGSENGVEIIGWLYQFYISERKDEVIGAKGKIAARDIPAATQLFTPHWIVRYMVENSLGRLWMEAHPGSRLKEKMPYYLESLPEENAEGGTLNDEVQQLNIVSTAARGLSGVEVQPQDLTVMDPACGSGHILVYAFDLLFEIYTERGYAARDIPALILEHNLHGLDIDERAVQLASFAVLMKARAKNPRILRRLPKMNIAVVRSTKSLVLPPGKAFVEEDWRPLLEVFENASNLGSLITPPDFDAEKLLKQVEAFELESPVFEAEAQGLRSLIKQAKLLRARYWVVVANPPYMSGSSFDAGLKAFVLEHYPRGKSDLFAAFMERCLKQTYDRGLMATINQHSWMFLSSYEKLRGFVLDNYCIQSMLHLGYGVFQELNSKVVQSTAFVMASKQFSEQEQGIYLKLTEFQGAGNRFEDKTLEAIANPDCGYLYYAKSADFRKIPGSAIASKVLSSNRFPAP
ncbi:MAG: BREX-1 system adenine-specific DNA-methyltransferase PglX [Cyanobacteria bacterium J06627_28]